MSPSSFDEDIRPGRFAGVEDSGGIVERFISEPKPDSALGRVLAKNRIFLDIMGVFKLLFIKIFYWERHKNPASDSFQVDVDPR